MTQNNNLTISAFFPYLNDWGTIGSLVTGVDSVLKAKTTDYEILIIDDGSNKMSKDLLIALKEKFSHVKIITHSTNKGYGGAIKSGIKESQMEWIFYTDGDAQYDPRELALLIEYANSADIINGYKIKRSDPWYRILTGRIYHNFVKILFNIPIRDTDCDFRLMRKSIFNKVELHSNSGLICAEMIKKIADNDFKFKEVPVHHYWRTSGKSQFFNFKRVGTVVIGLLVLWYKLVIKKEHLTNDLTHKS